MASLQGLVVAFAGIHTGSSTSFADKKLNEVKNLIEACGGSFAAKISGEVTHLVATSAQFSRNGAKVKDVMARYCSNIKIVGFDW